MTKRQKKRAEQRLRRACLLAGQKQIEEQRQKAEALVEKCKREVSENETYRKHALAFEILTDLIDISVTEIDSVLEGYGVKNTNINSYINKIKNITSEQQAIQSDFFIDKSDENYMEFADRSDFLYETLLLLTDVKDEDRVKVTSTIKLLTKNN